ncbi:MCE family protein [Rhodococcus triatomae]|uniref:Phospholipid/cholesterol/gamma-HCH transport system substrate-binding protein n=1 Tax=Rhodococcus triatomae TaxID=300028 RepID=A0A1G7ZSY2_9NOCA|nr:MCE family protein [Rhodococcus triatomae]QNG17959.1 MCE family protein [Rhodococcus triatomae]QNG22373.1 MCE family protein [Rhodococcus triatomae]SDH11747.1 phospholipid/cholesterol/gamma-HCH transport system substrate-binding protein [Rhodococcus triatomae]
MTNTPLVRTVAALAAVVPLSGCAAGFQHLEVGTAPPGDSYPLVLRFADAALLPVGGEVRIGQAVVGRVASMRVEDYTAVVEVRIRSDIALPEATGARIELTTPIGDAFVNLRVPPGDEGATLAPGATVDLSQTDRGPDIAQLLALVGNLLNGGGLGQIQSIVAESNAILGGREDAIGDLGRRVDGLLGTLEDRSSSIDTAIDSLADLSRQIGSETGTIDAALRAAAPAVDVLVGERARMLELTRTVHTLSVEVEEVLRRSGTQMSDVVAQLSPILDQIAATGPTLADTMGKVAVARDLVLRAAPGDYMNIDQVVEVDGTVLGVLSEVIPGAAPPVPPPAPAPHAAAPLPDIRGILQIVEGGLR